MSAFGANILSVLKKNLTPNQKQRLRSVIHRVLPAISPILRRDLKLLALLGGTDKLAHGYVDQYSRHLRDRRTDKLNLLEIGVKNGASLNMWKNYFHRSEIYGIDIDDKSHLDQKRIKTFKGDQSDVEFLTRVAQEIGDIDIIIDDGSHVCEHVLASFATLFPMLKNGGIYIIEDLQTSYWPAYGGAWRNLDDPKTSMSMLKQLVDGLNYPWIPRRSPGYLDQNIVSLHFYPKMAIIYKDHNAQMVKPDERAHIDDCLSET